MPGSRTCVAMQIVVRLHMLDRAACFSQLNLFLETCELQVRACCAFSYLHALRIAATQELWMAGLSAYYGHINDYDAQNTCDIMEYAGFFATTARHRIAASMPRDGAEGVQNTNAQDSMQVF